MLPKEEVEVLMNQGILLAKHMLGTLGEFYPFAHALTRDGQVRLLYPTVTPDRPRPEAIINDLLELFEREAREGTITAIALFCDVRYTVPETGERSDAVQIGMEHRMGYSMNAFLPYSRNASRVTYGRLFGNPRDAVVFRPF